jgi:hypothetical protein
MRKHIGREKLLAYELGWRRQTVNDTRSKFPK